MKPFLTIDQQVDLLESRGMETDGATTAALLHDGYYPIINGYKGPFLDLTATGGNRYKNGTRFSNVYELFRFDRALRELTFRYLMMVEAECKTVMAYTFCEAHRAPKAYLDPSSFASAREYRTLGFRDHSQALSKLHAVLNERAQGSQKGPIKHYRSRYGAVPLWVLTMDMTFGNTAHFFNLMKPGEQILMCKRIIDVNGHTGSTELGYFGIRDAVLSIDTLVKVRNMCAHDERLYCARIGGKRRDSYGMALQRMHRFLTDAQFTELNAGVLDLVEGSFQRVESAPYVLAKMGLARVGDGLRSVTAL